MNIPEPQAEHLWLHQLVGQWSIESEFIMGPGQPPMNTTGREIVRPLGKLWTIGEGAGNTPDSGSCDSMMTLGYDPQAKRFVGTFVASAMTHLWPYLGSLDASGKILTLDSEGPSFAGDGTMAKYQDIIEFVTHDYRTLTSRFQNADGSWHQFMTAHYRREQ
ncbi:MAG: DUF1579 domain-containing protein [Pirellulaceae bacterium]|nr:DUF1579 domain-containing protein [Pirellulaceae bacterium]